MNGSSEAAAMAALALEEEANIGGAEALADCPGGRWYVCSWMEALQWLRAFWEGACSWWLCNSAGEAVMGLRYRRSAGSGGSGEGEGRRSSVKGGDIESNERVRYSSREIAGAPKFEKERAADRSRAKDAVRFDLNPDFRLIGD